MIAVSPTSTVPPWSAAMRAAASVPSDSARARRHRQRTAGDLERELLRACAGREEQVEHRLREQRRRACDKLRGSAG